MTVTEADFWEQAARKGLPWFRWLRRSVPIAELDDTFQDGRLREEWKQLKEQIQPGDQVWPFAFHMRSYLGLRKGYLVLRRSKPIGGIVTEVS